jgi:hypothetical protein
LRARLARTSMFFFAAWSIVVRSRAGLCSFIVSTVTSLRTYSKKLSHDSPPIGAHVEHVRFADGVCDIIRAPRGRRAFAIAVTRQGRISRPVHRQRHGRCGWRPRIRSRFLRSQSASEWCDDVACELRRRMTAMRSNRPCSVDGADDQGVKSELLRNARLVFMLAV